MRILKSPYFVSAIVIIIVFFATKNYTSKYHIEELNELTEQAGEGQTIFACDLDSDGTSEFVRYKTSNIGEPSIVVHDDKLRPQGQWNCKGDFNPSRRFYGFGDYDSNGFKEIYFITRWGDSLFLNFVEPYISDYPPIRSINFATLKTGVNSNDIGESFDLLSDINGDGQKEVFITVRAGFSIEPREIIMINPGNGNISRFSQKHSIVTCQLVYDIDGDNLKEGFVSTTAPFNITNDSIYKKDDSRVSSIVLNHELLPKYDSLLTIRAPHANMITQPVIYDKDTLVLGMTNIPKVPNPKRYYWNVKGEFVDSSSMEVKEHPDGWQYRILSDDIHGGPIIASPNGFIYRIDGVRSIKKLGKHKLGWKFMKRLDINEDGVEEYIGVYDETYLLIYSDNFRSKSQIEIPRVDRSAGIINISIFYKKGEPRLLLQNGSITKLYSYNLNWLYWGQYIFLILGIGIFWIFTYMIQYQQRKQIQVSQRDRDEITKLQYQAIANQINPHFSYNILSTIGYSILNEDRRKAYDLLVKYSTLTRNLIEGGTQPDRTLGQEIGFVETYLELQKKRFEDSFDYSIDISGIINRDMLIPRMIILTFVENAIKHGLTPKEGHRKLDVSIKEVKSGVEIIITDNGVGRNSNKEINIESSGQGLEILDRIIEIHKKLHKRDISYNIVDIEDHGKKGTKVIIRL